MNPAMALNPGLVQSFIGTAAQVVGQLPLPVQTTILPELGGLAMAAQPTESITHETELRAKALLVQIVAVPDARRFLPTLARFMDAWGVESKPDGGARPPSVLFIRTARHIPG